MKYNIGDRIKTKKKHVCGFDEWEVLRVGAEIKIRCVKCNREVMVFKTELDKKVKTLVHIENQ
ncbi:DUF951 domain-containing protein [Peloplasma aerotolerans]|jgi:hypothetical protein|uniref:DUF951 domain-containing protein n=1 Tax=Peloplasma aerotolerans TaxID=3044389 RepID=A0AAW6U9W7_9MOLU|nr:DUF951 domain-containing protein [Mariniplasma sp. M4Ah]MDI6453670.1 DUF951 domain-containing protein [Mariniplasma sp. M4Ah]MDR4968846.1 DUF951 domain-containing protein [Acholeplasmataceae bacterium]